MIHIFHTLSWVVFALAGMSVIATPNGSWLPALIVALSLFAATRKTHAHRNSLPKGANNHGR